VKVFDNIHVSFYTERIDLTAASVQKRTEGRYFMNASHIATGTITSLLAMVLVYLTHWPLQPLDLPTASAFAGLIVAGVGGAVKFYQTMRPTRPIARVIAGPGGMVS
jgi:hypothetical protein